jgi:hypothetical protein
MPGCTTQLFPAGCAFTPETCLAALDARRQFQPNSAADTIAVMQTTADHSNESPVSASRR